ncbi:MAG TPA: hypothetical protein HA343_06290 [Methanomassiliicoccales archaeon]|nr:hypothetical protein [Methanomassiliicoccales archaeon]
MKWRSHISIGKAIADVLELPPGERKAFLDGIIEPDRHKERVNGPGYSYRVSHHHPSRRVVMLHVWMARRSFLRNNSYLGYRHLGMALHYLQDKSTSKGFLGVSHDRREEALAELPVPVEAIERGFKKYLSTPEFVSRSLELTKPQKDVHQIMAQASFRSAAVAAAVTDLRRPSGLEQKLRALRRSHLLVHVPLAIGALAIGASLSLAWWNAIPLATSVVISLIVLIRDRTYRRLNRVASWHGLKRQ